MRYWFSKCSCSCDWNGGVVVGLDAEVCKIDRMVKWVCISCYWRWWIV